MVNRLLLILLLLLNERVKRGSDRRSAALYELHTTITLPELQQKSAATMGPWGRGSWHQNAKNQKKTKWFSKLDSFCVVRAATMATFFVLGVGQRV